MKNKKLLLIFLSLCFFFLLIGCNDEIEKSYKIYYELDGGISEITLPNSYKHDDKITLPTLTKEDYNFLGWYLTNNYTGSPITVIDGSLQKDITLYAKWEKVLKTYTINYELDGGILPNNAPTSFLENSIVILPTPIKEGYQFLGWYENEVIVETITNKNYILVAKWEKNLETYTISYELDGGILPNNAPTSFLENSIVILPTPVKEGYQFLGWYENEVKVETITNQNYELVARWEKTYTITFNTDGGILEEYKWVINNLEDIVLPIPTKEGYRFLGWLDNNTSDTTYLEVIEKGFENDYELVAKWEKVYKISYTLNGGIMPDEYISEYAAGKGELLPVPSKDGYFFSGWKFECISGTYYNVPISFEEDVKISAVWKKEIYSVKYVFNNNEIYLNKDHLFASFFGDFYDYLINYRNVPGILLSSNINNLDEFYAFCGNYTGGAAGMSQVGNLLGSYFLKQRITKNHVNNLPNNPKENPTTYISIIKSQLKYQTADDGFVGYCLENNKYVEFIDFLVEFFFWWRIDEAYTGGSSDPNMLGSDFFASPWASIVDTAKFFYYEKSTLPSYFTKNEETPKMYDRIPNLLTNDDIEFIYEYDWEVGLVLPTDLNVEGYTFSGWYLNSDYTGDTVTKLDKNIYHNIVLYGKFIKEE